MNKWTDLFLLHPLPEGWLNGLLFVTFGLHLLFVLLMLGTAVLSLLFFLRDLLRRPSPDQHWNEHVAHSHMGLKSLAVVLGGGLAVALAAQEHASSHEPPLVVTPHDLHPRRAAGPVNGALPSRRVEQRALRR